MKIYFNKVKRFQEGGPVSGGDPMQQILEGAMQAVQSGDGNMALQVCEMLVQLAQQSQGGGAAPAPEEAAPAPEGEPVYRAGGKLIRRISK